MSNKVKTAKISTLIKRLQELQNAEGDLPIVFAKDSEGNSYNTIDPEDDMDYAVDDNVLILYPSSEINDTNDTLNDDSDLDEPRGVDNFEWNYDEDYTDGSDNEDDYYEDD